MQFLEKTWDLRKYRFYVIKSQNALWIHYQGQTYLWEKPQIKKEPKKSQSIEGPLKEEEILSPLPGKIHKIFVKKSQAVKTGDLLLSLSAMKMEYSFKAEGPGQVEEIFCTEGQFVPLKQKLLKIKYETKA